jgi:arginyl-tRNA synthetase
LYPEEGPWREFKEEIISELRKLNVRIEPIRAPEGKGDFTCICYQVAPEMKKDSKQIAADISEAINSSEHKWIAKCEAAGAYVNFTVCSEKLVKTTLDAVRSQTTYGSGQSKDKKVIIEHTSANPTDALHVGRTRNPIIGDTLARIMKAAGYNVETQYYVDDLGRQAVTLALGKYGLNEVPEADAQAFTRLKSESAGPYQLANAAADKFEWASSLRADWLGKLEHGDPEITKKVNQATDEVMAQKIKPTLDRIKVGVDGFVHESRFFAPTMEMVPKLRDSQLHGIKDGAHFLDFSQHGIEKEFFFLRADGTTVYATRDIAYHLWKSEQADLLINILGEDHKLESKFVELAITEVLEKPLNLDVVFYSFVSLPEGKMSTREGNVVLIDDLLEEAVERASDEVKKRRPDISQEQATAIANSVGIGAVRYNIIKVQPEKKIVFKWEDALNFEGESAPFIQYSHARACGILSKCQKVEDYDSAKLNHPSEIALVKKMADLPRLVNTCAEKRRCHPVAIYAHELASQFNQFYRDCPVAAAPTQELQAARAALTDAFKICMHNTLDLLGIDALEEM